MRKPFIAGNWKMNASAAAARELVSAMRRGLDGCETVDTAVCPPFVYLGEVAATLEGSSIALGAQDLYHEEKGAFTGEVSGAMLKDMGCRYVIVGHSERRHIFGESDDLINAKLKAAFREGLDPILCVGELLEERDQERTSEVVLAQLERGLAGLDPTQAARLTVAYEPVWAIGTGRTATPEQAQEVHALIRQALGRIVGDDAAQIIRIQYGGSVKPGNAADLLSQPDIDGALVGGASLDASSFVEIVRSTPE